MPAVNIRTATLKDLSQIMRLELQGFLPGTLESESVFRERLETFPQGFLVAEGERDRLLGYIASELWPYEERPDHSRFLLGHSISEVHSPLNDELYISSMTVAPETRRSGLGGQLFGACLDGCLERYPNVHSGILLVSEAWTHARKIYERFGFREVLRLDHFFRPHGAPQADGIVMRKDLRNGRIR